MSQETSTPKYMTPTQRKVLSSMYQAPQKGHTPAQLNAKLNTMNALVDRQVIVELNPIRGENLTLSESRRFRVTGAPIRVDRESLAV